MYLPHHALLFLVPNTSCSAVPGTYRIMLCCSLYLPHHALLFPVPPASSSAGPGTSCIMLSLPGKYYIMI